MFGASNELPDEEELTALYDRFMLRFMADYISEEFRFSEDARAVADRARTTLTLPSSTSCALPRARSRYRARS